MKCSLLKVASALLVLATMAAAAHARFTWTQSADAIWAFGCDFSNADIGSVRVAGASCSGACGRRAGCTHFAWTRYEGGTCWLKGGDEATIYTAIPSGKAGAVCGIMSRRQGQGFYSRDGDNNRP